MNKFQLKGCGTALLTPFKADGSVDYDAFAASVDRQVAAGIHFLVPLGTTGETPCLSDDEKVLVLSIAKEHAAGLPVVVGVGTNSLAGTVANIRLLEKDADAFLVVVPFYNKPTQEGQYQYFKAVAASPARCRTSSRSRRLPESTPRFRKSSPARRKGSRCSAATTTRPCP